MYDLNCIVEGEGLLKATSRHVLHNGGNISETVLDSGIVTTGH